MFFFSISLPHGYDMTLCLYEITLRPESKPINGLLCLMLLCLLKPHAEQLPCHWLPDQLADGETDMHTLTLQG